MVEAETQAVPRPRHPVLRTGERDPIDPRKRMLIHQRDGYSCQWCGLTATPWEREQAVERDPFRVPSLQLDHVVPWSANGSDRSDNLRSLCGPCNEGRSNYVGDSPRVIGVTEACYWCAKRRRQLPEHLVGVPVDELDRINAYCGRCGVTSWVPAESWLL